MPSRIKKLGLPLLMLLWAFCSGCFSMSIDNFCERCYDNVTILERRCEWSQDGKSFTVYCRKRIDYCRDPFKINTGSDVVSLSHTYSLTTPEPDAKLCRWTIVPSDKAHFVQLCYDQSEVKDGKRFHRDYRVPATVDYNRLVLPFILPPTVHWNHWDELGPVDICVTIHPEDLPLFKKPFLVSCGGYYLAIPYKMEGNICNFYVPKEDLVSETGFWKRPNASQIKLKNVLKPPAVVLDIITSPIQFCFIILDIMTGANISPYP